MSTRKIRRSASIATGGLIWVSCDRLLTVFASAWRNSSISASHQPALCRCTKLKYRMNLRFSELTAPLELMSVLIVVRTVSLSMKDWSPQLCTPAHWPIHLPIASMSPSLGRCASVGGGIGVSPLTMRA